MGKDDSNEPDVDTRVMETSVVVRNPGMMSMLRRSDRDDDITKEGILDNIETKQSLSDVLISEPSMGQRGDREAVKNITLHVCTVAPPGPGRMAGDGEKEDNTPDHQEHRDDASDKGDDGDSHQGGQSINVTVRKPRVLLQTTLTGSRISTPVRKTSSIASARMGGGGRSSGTPSQARRKCIYTKEGVCSQHGEGAKKA